MVINTELEDKKRKIYLGSCKVNQDYGTKESSKEKKWILSKT